MFLLIEGGSDRYLIEGGFDHYILEGVPFDILPMIVMPPRRL